MGRLVLRLVRSRRTLVRGRGIRRAGVAWVGTEGMGRDEEADREETIQEVEVEVEGTIQEAEVVGKVHDEEGTAHGVEGGNGLASLQERAHRRHLAGGRSG